MCQSVHKVKYSGVNDMKNFLFLIFCGLLSCQLAAGEKWTPIRDSKLSSLKNEINVSISGPGRGITARVGVRKEMLADITFEAKGNIPLTCGIFSTFGATDSAPMSLTNEWKSYKITYCFLKTSVTFQFRGRQKGDFSIRNFKITPAELPAFSDSAVPGTELDLTRGKHGRIVKIDGKSARRGGKYTRLLLIAPPQTTKMLYLYLDVKAIGKGKQKISLVRNRQTVAETTCTASNQWQTLKLGPVPAYALYPEADIVIGGNAVDIAISRAVFSTEPDLKPDKIFAKQTSTPGLAAGRGKTGVNAGPFIKIKENRFADEQSSVKLTYDDNVLRAEFFCKEKVLDPAANRLHEFKTQEKELTANDYVVLLLLRKGKLYDFFVTGAGKLENASATGPSYWQTRKTAWNSGAKVKTVIGNGFWKTVIEIPWKAVGGVPRQGEKIKFQAGRKSNSAKELSVLFPTAYGFHWAADFGNLFFTDKVPETKAKLPAFLPGKNVFECNGAAFRGKIHFPGFPAQFIAEKNFDLNHSGKFTFFWQALDPEQGTPVYNSPVYELATTATQIYFDKAANISLNGKTVNSGALLNDGLNQIELPPSFKGSLLVNGSKIVPPDKKFTLAVNASLLWPNWQAQELAVTRGGLQMLLFSPVGFPGMTLNDYTLKLNLPPGFTLECASGYYNNHKIKYTSDGEIRFLNEIPYSKVLPSHKFAAAFIRIPKNFKGTYTQLSFSAESKKHKVIEVPQKVRVRILPELKAAKNRNLKITISTGWLRMLTDKKYIDTVVRNLMSAGVNCMSTVPNKYIPYGYMFNFKSWSWTLAPYTKLHPEAALTLKNGKKDPLLVCPEHIRKPEFYAWLETQIPLWMKKAGNPPIVEWDYEYGYSTGPFSCYCSVCSKKSDVVSRNQNMADFTKLIRKALKKHNSKTLFSIYSAYQSEKNKHVYGIDWRMVKDLVDYAICGYGRPEKELQETLAILGKTPLMTGAIVTPYDATSRAYPRQFTAAWLLRRAVDSTGGILLYQYTILDGHSLSACAKVSQIMAKYEDFIRFGKRLAHSVPGWTTTDIQVIEYKNKKVLFLMNQSNNTRRYRGQAVPAGGILISQL